MAIKISELLETQTGVADDRGLVIDFKAGDANAYAEIYRRYFAYARTVSLRILRNPEDADEAAQETMVRVLQALPRFNGRYELRAWIARIATNVSLDMVRSTSRRTRNLGYVQSLDLVTIGDQLDRTGEDPSETVERMVQAHQVQALLSELPANHRDALVLREVQGRSHQEIADELGMTPPQVKALIHRAKGSFRRMWTGREGTGGVAGFFLFLIPLRFAGGVKRIVEQAGNAGRATASAAPAVSAATSSPAAQAAASETGQKVVAAAVTLLVAGSLTVGGVAYTRHRTQPVAPAASVVAPAPAPVLVPQPAAPNHVHHQIRPARRTHHPARPAHRGTPGAGPGGAPSPGPSGRPSPDPSGTPTPDPSGTPPPPVIGPAPAWGMTFAAGIPGSGACTDCPPNSQLISSDVSGQAGQSLSISQVAEGSALDSQGNAAWKAYIQYWGSTDGTAGSLNYEFRLDGADGWNAYSGGAALSSVERSADGGYVYTFMGSYHLDQPTSDASVPQAGTMEVRFRVWPDGTSLYATDITLYEV